MHHEYFENFFVFFEKINLCYKGFLPDNQYVFREARVQCNKVLRFGAAS